MKLTSPAHMVVVKKEDKEARLREFLLDAIGVIEAGDFKPVLRLLARSNASPVVHAIIGLQAELAAAGVEAHVLFATVEGPCSAVIGRDCSFRHLADVRYHDAHELMVASPAHTWTGDCMRRDPATRDSFELHAAGCVQSAKWATSSFDKLWTSAVLIEGPSREVHAVAMEMAADLAGLGVEQPSAPQVLTRH